MAYYRRNHDLIGAGTAKMRRIAANFSQSQPGRCSNPPDARGGCALEIHVCRAFEPKNRFPLFCECACYSAGCAAVVGRSDVTSASPFTRRQRSLIIADVIREPSGDQPGGPKR